MGFYFDNSVPLPVNKNFIRDSFQTRILFHNDGNRSQSGYAGPPAETRMPAVSFALFFSFWMRTCRYSSRQYQLNLNGLTQPVPTLSTAWESRIRHIQTLLILSQSTRSTCSQTWCIQKTWVQVFFGAYMRLFYQQLCNIGRLSQGWRQKWRICKRNYCDSLTTRSKNLNTTKTINIHCMTHIDVPTGRVTEGASDTVSNVRVTVMLQTSQPWSQHGAEWVGSRDSESMCPVLVFAHSAYFFSRRLMMLEAENSKRPKLDTRAATVKVTLRL
jgi:hypothetical protein